VEGRGMVKCRESTFSIAIFLLTLLIVACIPQVNVSAVKGPRTEDLIMYFYSNVSTAYYALVAGEVDVVGSMIPESLYSEAITNPNVALAPVDDMGMYEFDLNNNYSIPTYPGVRSPTSYTEFRQALAFLVDKERIVEEFCDGFATRMDQPIAPPAHGWMNKSYTGANYPYQYDPAAASALMDANGWAEGATPNPYYDAAFPGSTEYIRTYPTGHETAGADIDPVITYLRTDDPRRLQAGLHLYGNMRKIGIPVDAITDDWHWSDKVFGLRDYHIYTGGWSLGRFPTFPYFGYHTDYYIPFGSNYVTGYQADNATPSHPELDPLLYNIYYADTFEQAYRNCQLAMGLFTELCVTIPLFSARSFWAYSTTLLAAVNMDGHGLENKFFFLNAYKADGSPIIWGVTNPPNSLNILYFDWHVRNYFQGLDRIYDYASSDQNPYNIAFDQPGWVLDWLADTWVDPDDGVTKAKNFKQLRSDNYFVDAEGNQLENVDADDYLFSNYVTYAIGIDCWNWHIVQHVKCFNKVNATFVEIYYDARSYWLYTAASPSLIPRSVFLNTSYGLTQHLVKTFVVGTNLTTPGFLGLGPNRPNGPCWINSITSDLDGVLTEWVDFRWELGDWYIDTPLTSGAVVTVDYYAIDDVSGYTLGDNPLEDVTIGCGMYYATGYSPGVGGNFTAKKNPYYYLETPILGEVDFMWEDGGYYEVTIFDVVMAAGAYGSQGIAFPDRNWFPGADLAPPGGVIDIFDIITVASNYGKTFGAPPA
ncbi:MAG: ABC transporter substrate-binding protein, partial [Candidatus Bathyarchaeota archaeon]|nr:ABC transporter substrate-binding protein [Candidatus Bathyarchaeota archaeon]